MVVKSTLSPGLSHDPQNVALHDSAVCCAGGGRTQRTPTATAAGEPNDEHKDDISKEHTEGGHNEQDHEQLPDDSALNHNNNENELTTPKCRSTPKEEEDDLDMDDDDLEDNDNENDASHLDEFRSPSPAMDGNLVAASHKDQQLPFPMVPNSMFSQSFMYMSHYMPAFGQAAAAAGHTAAHHHAAAAAAAAGIALSSIRSPKCPNWSNGLP
ncbi:uncharacterized protein Dwil_GK20247 [Drosophila willistoni]|uniref:Uncharacterized protein n=1 Tax=Drosophila willistoni TaxID=7260 RepID=B4MHV0_DROWI|nr:uncharacterized protein Dwil_GK20247 [Drosophila willistoni]